MKKAEKGDTVEVHYRGTLEDGEEFDSSRGGDPIEFTIGAGQVIPGFENAVVGMGEGETRQQKIEANDAYGEHEEDLIFEVDRAAVPIGNDVSVGDILELTFPNGENAPVRIAQINEKSVMLDANHPLTGKTLVFELELMKIK